MNSLRPSRPTIQQRAINGATLLDIICPGWASHQPTGGSRSPINLDTLDIQCDGTCVLAQIGDGSFASSAHTILDDRDPVPLGFYARRRRHGLTTAEEYEALTQEWRHQILERRMPTMFQQAA